ncbi:hypothetical protein B0H11DRAFT_2305139 [Mycena galericulata]|nr:hypothetical protein B0H11DRAFT_2305139 [Mycena galericulata]
MYVAPMTDQNKLEAGNMACCYQARSSGSIISASKIDVIRCSSGQLMSLTSRPRGLTGADECLREKGFHLVFFATRERLGRVRRRRRDSILGPWISWDPSKKITERTVCLGFEGKRNFTQEAAAYCGGFERGCVEAFTWCKGSMSDEWTVHPVAPSYNLRQEFDVIHSEHRIMLAGFLDRRIFSLSCEVGAMSALRRLRASGKVRHVVWTEIHACGAVQAGCRAAGQARKPASKAEVG